MYVSATALFRSRISTDGIRKDSQYKLTVRSVAANSRQIKSLSKALRTANLERVLRELDVRYAFIIRDSNQKDVLTLFMNFGEHLISINGTVYKVNSDLVGWFKDIARAVVKITNSGW